MAKTVKAPKVRWAVFNVEAFCNAHSGARVIWEGMGFGRVVKRNSANGRFCSQPFTIMGR